MSHPRTHRDVEFSLSLEELCSTRPLNKRNRPQEILGKKIGA